MTSNFEKFNPYKEAKFKQSYTGDNQEFNLTKDGCPIAVKGEDGIARLLMGPAIFLKKSTMLNWFKSVYPDGVVDEELISYEPKRVILKVNLYKNHSRAEFISSAHGVATEKNHFYDVFREMNAEGTENSADLYNLAFYLGLKQALDRAGFTLNYDPDFLMEHVPGYRKACHTGEKVSSGEEVIIEYTGIAGPGEKVLQKEERILQLEELVEKNAAEVNTSVETEESCIEESAKEMKAELNADLPGDPLEGKDPIQEFLKSIEEGVDRVGASQDASQMGKASAEEEESPAAKDEVINKTELSATEDNAVKTDFGKEIFKVGPTAGIKLKAYDGEKLEDIPEEILAYIVSKTDWNGKISEEMIHKIKEYLF